MTDDFILQALVAGIGIALMAAPLGCFVAWQRLAYFGDTIAHAALLGVVLALMFHMEHAMGIGLVALAVSTAVYYLEREKKMSSGMLLGLFAHGALALGLVLIALSHDIVFDINGLLFGDILAVNIDDIAGIYVIAIAILGFIAANWRNLMRMTIHPDIAMVEGVAVGRLKWMLMCAIALAVAISIKLVGILLITSMLIIPAAAVRSLARTPTQMVGLAMIAGILSVGGGLSVSLRLDTPSGASIILVAMVIFIAAYAAGKLRSIITGT